MRKLSAATKRYIEYFIAIDVDSTEGFLKSLQLLCGFIIGTAVFIKLLRERLYSQGWEFIFSEHVLANSLMLLFLIRFLLSMQSVRMEMRIGSKLFPPERIPKELGGPNDKKGIIILVIMFSLLYLSLAWTTDYIWISSIAMLIIACIDFNTRRLINKGIKRSFADKQYTPDAGDKDYDIIEKRRGVARHFLEKPHLWKEAGCVAGCGVSVFFALKGYFLNQEWMNIAAYLVLIVTLIVNEIFSQLWRIELFSQWRSIENRA